MNIINLYRTISKGKSHWRRKNSATVIVIIAFCLLVLGIALTEYIGFSMVLNILNETPEFKLIIISYTLHSLFAIIFALIIVSGFVSSPILFLRNNDDHFLLSLPLKTTSIFLARFFGQLSLLIWTAFLFGIPIILAIGINTNLGFSFYLIALLFLVFLIIIGGVISNILLFPIIALTKKYNSLFSTLLIIVGVGLLLYALVRTITPSNLTTLILANTSVNDPLALDNLSQQFRFWPSTFYAELLLGSIKGNFFFNINSVILLVITSITLLIQHYISHTFYRSALQTTQEGRIVVTKNNGLLAKITGLKLYLIGEWTQLLRNRSDRNQLILFFFLFILYIGFLFNLPHINNEPDIIWTPRIIFFILITITYFIVLLALRFTFPFASLEKNKSWFNLTLPKVRSRSYFAHILASFLPTMIILELIILLTSFALSFPISFTLPFLIINPVLCFTIITITSVIGTVFPTSRNINPESLSTTPSGLLAFALSVGYASITTFALYLEAKVAINQGVVGIHFGLLYYIVIISSLVIAMILYKFGQNSYNRLHLN